MHVNIRRLSRISARLEFFKLLLIPKILINLDLYLIDKPLFKTAKLLSFFRHAQIYVVVRLIQSIDSELRFSVVFPLN